MGICDINDYYYKIDTEGRSCLWLFVEGQIIDDSALQFFSLTVCKETVQFGANDDRES
jgi:hypothetical protein